MLIKKGEKVKIIVPTDNPAIDISNWTYLIDHDAQSYDGKIKFQKNQYYVFEGTVETAPESILASDGSISADDLKWMFGVGNSGCTIVFEVKDEHDLKSILVTWTHVLLGRMDGLQVWTKRNSIRNLSKNFCNNIHSKDKLLSLVNNIYPEIYGNPVQLGNLLMTYYKYLSQVVKPKTNNSTCIDLTNIEMNHPEVKTFIAEIDKTFEVAIEQCFTNFTPIGKPLLGFEEMNQHIEKYKLLLPYHYQTMKYILCIDKKEKEIRNNHLQHYYDRQCFYQFLCQVRIMNNHQLSHWGQVCAASGYSHGQGDYAHPRASFFGIRTNYDSLLNHCKQYSSEMKNNIQCLMKKHNYVVAGLDNNQKGYPLQHQRGGEHCKFQKVTSIVLKKYNPIPTNCPNPPYGIDITYIQQKIPSPFNMPHYETVVSILSAISKLLINPSFMKQSNNDIDFTGLRVESYMKILSIVEEICNGIYKFLTGWSSQSKSFKRWNYQPMRFITKQRSYLIKLFSKAKTTFIQKCRSFQRNNVCTWNPNINIASEIIVPPVSLRDEMKTSGYGIAVIELLILVGILVEKDFGKNDKRWYLAPDYSKRRLILAVDGLSMDRHRGFQKKLATIKTSFTQHYEQAKIFKLAFGQIIEVNGQLHMAFHMLQSVFIIFHSLIQWAVDTVKWKRIKITKVSQNFRLCRRLAFMLQEEIQRYTWDLFLFRSSKTIDVIVKDSKDVGTIMINLTKHYITWIDRESRQTTDEHLKYLLNYL